MQVKRKTRKTASSTTLPYYLILLQFHFKSGIKKKNQQAETKNVLVSALSTFFFGSKLNLTIRLNCTYTRFTVNSFSVKAVYFDSSDKPVDNYWYFTILADQRLQWHSEHSIGTFAPTAGYCILAAQPDYFCIALFVAGQFTICKNYNWNFNKRLDIRTKEVTTMSKNYIWITILT